MYRSHTCGELRISDVNKQVTLAGWVQRSRKMGGMTFIDLRDRYGITQLVFNEEVNAELCERANRLGREFVIQVKGTVNERFSKNQHIPTGDIETGCSELIADPSLHHRGKYGRWRRYPHEVPLSRPAPCQCTQQSGASP